MTDQPSHTEGPGAEQTPRMGILRPTLKRILMLLTFFVIAIVMIYSGTQLFERPEVTETEALPNIRSGSPPLSDVAVSAGITETDSSSPFAALEESPSEDVPTFIAPAETETTREPLISEPSLFIAQDFRSADELYAHRESKLLDALHASPVVALDDSIYPDEEIVDGASTDRPDDYEDSYALVTGTVLPAVLLAGITTDQPGLAIAHVSQDVYDSQSGNVLLIPRGSRVTGSYSRDIAITDRRVTITWEELSLPDGTVYSLDNVIGADVAGHAGIEDQVNHRIGRAVTVTTLSAALTGALTNVIDRENQLQQAAAQVPVAGGFTPSLVGDLEPGSESAGQLPSLTYQAPAPVTASAAVSAEIARQYRDLTRDITRRYLGEQPSLTIRPGIEFTILLGETMKLPEYTM